MQKIAIVSDSTACLSEEEKSKYLVELVPVNVMSEGKVYKDGVDLTPSEAYRLLEKNPDDWATSAPSPGDFLLSYKRLAEKGAEAIICVLPPPKLSATLNSAVMAKTLAEGQMPQIKIEVFDSGTAMAAETLILKRLFQAIDEGKTFGDLIQLTKALSEKARLYLLLETIRYIYRSGRIPEIASKIGGLLPLKPILGVFSGKFQFIGATLSKDRSKQKVLETLKENLDPSFPEVALMYIDDLSEAESLKKEISSMMPEAKIMISEFSPIIGYAMGKGTLGVGFFNK